MISRRRITLVTLFVLGILLAGGALLGLCDIYQNHVARDCGDECGTPPPGRPVGGI